MACKQEYSLEQEVPRRWALDDGLSARNWTSIVQRPNGKFIRKQCRHCIDPACVSACPVGALKKTPEGAVIYDSSRCMGCRYCMMACPYGIPRYDWDQAVPYIRKCILCYDRIREGSQPACVEACPTQATIFGNRDELLAEAHKRIRENPGKYIKRVWGEKEIGGSQVLYISDIDLSFLTYDRPLGDKPVPKRTAAAMNAVPFAFVGMGSAMAGISWIIGRRMKMQKNSLNEPEDKGDE